MLALLLLLLLLKMCACFAQLLLLLPPLRAAGWLDSHCEQPNWKGNESNRNEHKKLNERTSKRASERARQKLERLEVGIGIENETNTTSRRKEQSALVALLLAISAKVGAAATRWLTSAGSAGPLWRSLRAQVLLSWASESSSSS